jgi:hypothetical protein
MMTMLRIGVTPVAVLPGPAGDRVCGVGLRAGLVGRLGRAPRADLKPSSAALAALDASVGAAVLCLWTSPEVRHGRGSEDVMLPFECANREASRVAVQPDRGLESVAWCEADWCEGVLCRPGEHLPGGDLRGTVPARVYGGCAAIVAADGDRRASHWIAEPRSEVLAVCLVGVGEASLVHHPSGGGDFGEVRLRAPADEHGAVG